MSDTSATRRGFDRKFQHVGSLALHGAGIASRLCACACSEEGPTVQGILAMAAASGYLVTLRTV